MTRSTIGSSLAESTFAVVDVETTGLYPGGHDRIIEVAVVNATSSGEVLDEFVTLVNPDRDVGDTNIHGISAGDLQGAPPFREVAGELVERLSGSVFVAHNAPFDERFLRSEFARLGEELPPLPRLCTMRLRGQLCKGVRGRRLIDCCRHFGILHLREHSALDDARATGQLLAAYMGIAQEAGISGLAELGCEERLSSNWPTLRRSGWAFTREAAARDQDDKNQYLSRLLERLPSEADLPASVDGYMELLDRALEDRILTTYEAHSLVDVAQECGLAKRQVQGIHEAYLSDLVAAALEDDVVTDAERQDLATVASLLSVPLDDLDALLRELQRAKEKGGARTRRTMREELAGMSVCFTGKSHIVIDGERVTKSRAKRLAEAAGLEVKKDVTKSLKILVVVDPKTMSGKAKKARAYGTRILAEAVFWEKLGHSAG